MGFYTVCVAYLLVFCVVLNVCFVVFGRCLVSNSMYLWIVHTWLPFGISWWSVLMVEETGVHHILRKPHTCRKSPIHFITWCIEYSNTPRHEWDSNSQLRWLYALTSFMKFILNLSEFEYIKTDTLMGKIYTLCIYHYRMIFFIERAVYPWFKNKTINSV
jgi:hypothetical protein